MTTQSTQSQIEDAAAALHEWATMCGLNDADEVQRRIEALRTVGLQAYRDSWCEDGMPVDALPQALQGDEYAAEIIECAQERVTEELAADEYYELDEPVLVEVLPASRRASHEAAGNCGRYPHNGAVRTVCDRSVVPEDHRWIQVLRTATERDAVDYGVTYDLDSL